MKLRHSKLRASTEKYENISQGQRSRSNVDSSESLLELPLHIFRSSLSNCRPEVLKLHATDFSLL